MAVLNFSRNQQLALLVILGVSLIGLAYGKVKLAGRPSVAQSSMTVIDTTTANHTEVDAPSTKSDSSASNTSLVTVHVAGCVKNPSVYKLPAGSRVVDAVHMAGGPTAEADLNTINLAALLRDGQQILISSKVPKSPAAAPTISASPSSSSSAASGGAVVNINTAGIDELDLLPGVGPVTAQKIIDYRSRIGRFSSVEQLEEVPGIGPKKLEQMRPFVRL